MVTEGAALAALRRAFPHLEILEMPETARRNHAFGGKQQYCSKCSKPKNDPLHILQTETLEGELQ